MTDTLRCADLKHNETLHEYLTQMRYGWQALLQLEYTYEGKHYSELYPKLTITRNVSPRRSQRLKKT